jgi:hypothetical protein
MTLRWSETVPLFMASLLSHNKTAPNTAILILTHPASSIYTTEEAPLSRGDSPKKPLNEA